MILGLRRRPVQDTSARARLKARLGLRLLLGPDDSLTVSEVACGEPGCPDVETVVLLMRDGLRTRAAKIGAPIQDVSDEDIEDVVSALLGPELIERQRLLQSE